MVKRESGTRSLAWCIIAFSLGCVICAFMGCNEAHRPVDALPSGEECEEPPVDMDNTIPIPIRDGVGWDAWPNWA